MSEPPRQTPGSVPAAPTLPTGANREPLPNEPPHAAPDHDQTTNERRTIRRLRERLQVFNLVLSLLFATFCGVAAFRLLIAAPMPGYNPSGALIANGLATLIAGGIVLALRLQPSPDLRLLRIIQTATMTLILVFCAWYTLEKLYDNADQLLTRFVKEHAVFSACAFSFAWFGPLLCYGTFLANRWQRLAVETLAFVLAPLLVCLTVAAFDAEIGQALSGVFYLVMFTVMAAGGGVVVYSCYHENRLQQDVIEARRVGPYRLREKLGEGGMGVVYKAEHRLVKRPCAIKFIHKQALADPAQRQRFFREFQALARLSHWNLVEVYDFGESPDGTCYYVMEYLDGQSLHDLVRQSGPLPPGRVLYLLRQACEAIRMAHRLGLVHRDLKPSNLFLTRKGGTYDVVKVLDFGLVHDTSHALGGWTLTNPGAIMGTPGYMPPEQSIGSTIDARSDIYSLGAVAYFLLSGRSLYTGGSVAEVLALQLTREPEPLQAVQPGLPDDVVAVVDRCLARDPKARFQNVDELLAALDACACAGDWSPRQAEIWHATREEKQPEPATLTLPAEPQGTVPTRQ